MIRIKLLDYDVPKKELLQMPKIKKHLPNLMLGIFREKCRMGDYRTLCRKIGQNFRKINCAVVCVPRNFISIYMNDHHVGNGIILRFSKNRVYHSVEIVEIYSHHFLTKIA